MRYFAQLILRACIALVKFPNKLLKQIMKRFPTEFFISRRISSRKGSGSGGVMNRIASLTVGIGLAVMIISLAVIAGFRTSITDSLTGFGSHIQIVRGDNYNALETLPVMADSAFVENVSQLAGCRTIYPFAVKGGMIRGENTMQGVVLKGVGTEYDWSFFRSSLIEGELPDVRDTVRNKDILISRLLADIMEIGVGDKAEMIFVREGDTPRRDRFRVCGIYGTGFEEMDRVGVITDIRNVQRLNGWSSSEVTGYEVMARSMNDMEGLDEGINSIIARQGPQGDDEYTLASITIKARFPGLFDWLQAHNVNAAVIITIMLLVAFLNMVSALLIIILERTQMVGTLKAMGMRNSAVQRIFVIRSSYIVLKGMLWGNAAGLAICLVQWMWHPVKLDRAGYFLTYVPVEFGWGWWAALNAGSFLVIVVLMTLPTMIISMMKPDTTLRFR